MKKFSKRQVFAVQILILLVISYTLPLQAYLYQQPNLVRHDFYHYLPMYLSPFDLSAENAPFIFRQLGAVIVHAIYRLGIFVDYDIRFEATEQVRRIFFAAILMNYVGLLVCLGFVVDCVNRATRFAAPLIGLLAGLIVLQGYAVDRFVVSPLLEGATWGFVAALFWCQQTRRDRMFYALVLLSVTLREVIPFIFAVWSLVAAWQRRANPVESRRYKLHALASAMAFGVYLLERLWLFPGEAAYSHQLTPARWLDFLGLFVANPMLMLKISLPQNMLYVFALLYLAVALVKGRKNVSQDIRWGAVRIGTTVAVLAVAGIAAGLSANVARVVMTLSPLVAVYSALLLQDLLFAPNDTIIPRHDR